MDEKQAFMVEQNKRIAELEWENEDLKDRLAILQGLKIKGLLTTRLPKGCYCAPGRCMKPKWAPCRDPTKAAMKIVAEPTHGHGDKE